jgi:proteasome lid subunit RPN8/RPN11
MMRIGELFHHAIQRCAASIIGGHNHPSGDPTHSAEDISLTRSLGIYIFPEGILSVSEEAIWCFRGSYLSKPARTMAEDYSKFDTLEQDNVARKVI